MKNYSKTILMVALAMLCVALTGCNSNSRPSNQTDGEQYADGEQTETNAPTSFASKQDVLDYVLECWWTCDEFKILLSTNAGFKYQRVGNDSPSVSDLNYIEVRRFEGSEAIVEYSYDNIAVGHQTIRSEVNLTDGTLKFGINILHKEGDVRFEQKDDIIEEAVDSVASESYD